MTPLSANETEALLATLEAMRIEPEGARQSFVVRLAQENGWSASFAERVLHEYRRFLFLAATAGHAVTPSDEVDQAWHLHLAYSRYYWDELCARILRQPLHHGPTAGGRAADSRYRSQYAQTLATYRATFGSEAPNDIWPPERERFSGRYQRVNRRRNWILPKLPWRLAILGLLVAGCALESGERGLGPVALVALACIAFLVMAARFVDGSKRRSREDTSSAHAGPMCGGGGGGGSPCTDDACSGDGDCGGDAGGGDGGGGCGNGCGGGCGGGGCGS